MGKSIKKSAPKVDAAVIPTKPLKKGKREAEEDEKKSAKKPKKDLVEEKIEIKTKKKIVKKADTTSFEDTSSESKKQLKVKVSAKNGALKPDSVSDDSSVLEEDVSVLKKTPAAKNGHVAAAKKKEESNDESEDETSSDEDVAPTKTPAAVTKNVPVAASKKKDESSSESEDETSSDEDVATVKKAPESDSSDEDDSSDEESDDGEPQKKKIKVPDPYIKMVNGVSVKTKTGKGGLQTENTPKTPITPKEQPRGSKTLFVGNLSFSVEQADVENFFKDAGQLVEVRFSMNQDNSFKGFGHVEFATAAEAEKALREMNGKELLGRPVKLDLARERGSFTPHSGERDTPSFQKGGRAQGQTIFVRGFNNEGEEDQIRSSLEDHFGSCGEISRVSLPKDQEGGFKGIAYIDFTEREGFNKALGLNGSDIGEYTLTVEESKPRNDASGGPRGGRGGRGSGGFGHGGRFGDGGRGGRFGSSGHRGGRFGDSRGGRFGRGRGNFNKPSMAAPGTGKKTTFNDDE